MPKSLLTSELIHQLAGAHGSQGDFNGKHTNFARVVTKHFQKRSYISISYDFWESLFEVCEKCRFARNKELTLCMRPGANWAIDPPWSPRAPVGPLANACWDCGTGRRRVSPAWPRSPRSVAPVCWGHSPGRLQSHSIYQPDANWSISVYSVAWRRCDMKQIVWNQMSVAADPAIWPHVAPVPSCFNKYDFDTAIKNRKTYWKKSATIYTPLNLHYRYNQLNCISKMHWITC